MAFTNNHYFQMNITGTNCKSRKNFVELNTPSLHESQQRKVNAYH